MKKWCIALAAVATLTACSSGSAYASASNIASKIGCTSPTPSQQLNSQSGVSCTLDGKKVDIYVFANNTARDNWLVVPPVPGIYYGKGEKWAIRCVDRSVTEKAVAAAGGTMMP